MQDEKIKNLTDDEFHELAKSQSKKFPGLLKFRTEEEIIWEFYQYYGKKLSHNPIGSNKLD